MMYPYRGANTISNCQARFLATMLMILISMGHCRNISLANTCSIKKVICWVWLDRLCTPAYCRVCSPWHTTQLASEPRLTAATYFVCQAKLYLSQEWEHRAYMHAMTPHIEWGDDGVIVIRLVRDGVCCDWRCHTFSSAVDESKQYSCVVRGCSDWKIVEIKQLGKIMLEQT